MMRIAATDYDGTLKRNGEVRDHDLAAIHEWRRQGNIFGIVTGRDRSMLLPEIEQWNIPYDFLACCNGAALYDHALASVADVLLADEMIAPILRHPSSMASMHFELCYQGEVRLHILDPCSWFPALGTPYTEISYEEAFCQSGLYQISLAYTSAVLGKRHADLLREAFGDCVLVNHNGDCIDITAFGVDKATGLETLLAVMNWPEKGLLCIGDGENDVPMLTRFGGFTVPGGAAGVIEKARGVYEGVGAMLQDALKKRE